MGIVQNKKEFFNKTHPSQLTPYYIIKRAGTFSIPARHLKEVITFEESFKRLFLVFFPRE